MATRSDQHRLSRRYATALFALAQEQKALPRVEKDLADLAGMLDDSQKLCAVLVNPVIPKRILRTAVEELVKRAKLSSLTKQFCQVLVENRRLGLLPDIIPAFASLAEESRGEMRATVTSAAKLSTKHKDAISKKLKKATGKTVIIDTVVDTSILGGVKVEIGSTLWDGSLDGKLDRLRVFMKQSEAA